MSRVPEFLEKANKAALAAVPGLRICAFGHIGDGNLHYNLNQPSDADGAAYVKAGVTAPAEGGKANRALINTKER